MRRTWKKQLVSGILAVLILLFALPSVVFAAAPIRTVEITLIEPVVGGEVDTDPKTAKGAHYTMNDFRWFESDTGEESAYDWMAGDSFRAGKYYGFQCIVQTDDGYGFSDSVKVLVNGKEAEATPGPVENMLIVQMVYGPLTVPLRFEDQDAFDIPEGEAGTEIESFSVAGAVSGGKAPYHFELLDGPDWLEISEDGTVSGTRPEKEQVKCSATIRVVDNGASTECIEIQIGHVNPKTEAEEPEESGEDTEKETGKENSGVSKPVLMGALVLGAVGIVQVIVLLSRRKKRR